MADTIAFKSLYPYYSLNDEGLAFYYFNPTGLSSLTLTEQQRSGSNCYLRGAFDPSIYIDEYPTVKSDVLDPTNWPNPIDSTGTLADIYELKTQWNGAGTQCTAPKYFYSSVSQIPAPSVAVPYGKIFEGMLSYGGVTTTYDSDGYPASATFTDVDVSRQWRGLSLSPTKTSDSVAYNQFYLGGRFGLLSDTSAATSIWYGLFTPQTGDVLAFEYSNGGARTLVSYPEYWQAAYYKLTSGWILTYFGLYGTNERTYPATTGRVSLSINEVPQ